MKLASHRPPHILTEKLYTINYFSNLPQKHRRLKEGATLGRLPPSGFLIDISIFDNFDYLNFLLHVIIGFVLLCSLLIKFLRAPLNESHYLQSLREQKSTNIVYSLLFNFWLEKFDNFFIPHSMLDLDVKCLVRFALIKALCCTNAI